MAGLCRGLRRVLEASTLGAEGVGSTACLVLVFRLARKLDLICAEHCQDKLDFLAFALLWKFRCVNQSISSQWSRRVWVLVRCRVTPSWRSYTPLSPALCVVICRSPCSRSGHASGHIHFGCTTVSCGMAASGRPLVSSGRSLSRDFDGRAFSMGCLAGC